MRRVSGPSSDLDLTVVIPVHERADELDSCLAALGQAASVLVVDDGSADRDGIAAVCARHGARVLRREQAGGPAEARNAGLAAAETELIAFIDSDVVPSAGWLAPLVAEFADPDVAAAAPRVLPLERPEAETGFRERFVASRSPLDMGPRSGDVVPGELISYVPTAALVVRRSALREPFDADLRYGEDIDFIWRLYDEGRRVTYNASVLVRHDEPRSWGKLLGRRRSYGTAAAPLARRYGRRMAPFTVRPWSTSTALLLLAQLFAPAAVLGAAGIALQAGRDAGAGGSPLGSAKDAARAVAVDLVGLGRMATRLWWPLLALGVLFGSNRWRRAALVLLVAPPLLEWHRRRPEVDPLRWTLVSVVEDAVFGSGVWAACVSERNLIALLPVFGEEGEEGRSAAVGNRNNDG
jgi:mycofactocin system glycosyltransferase